MSSVGFLPEMPKRATIANVEVGAGGTIPNLAGAAFVIRNAATGDTAFSGTLPAGRATWGSDTRDSSRVADFSALTAPGTYYLQMEPLGRGPNFRIANDVFNTPYRAMMLGMFLWRCGMPAGVSAEYDGRTFSHGACHLNDANTRHIGGGQNDTRDAVGGWHDAGDYNKYTVNSGVTVGMLLKAWENHGETIRRIDLLPVNTPNAYREGMPKFLAEVKWNLDWVAKMQYSETDGRVSHKLSAINFCGYIKPEEETAARFFVPWGTAATASFVAQMALGARLYEPYDPVAAAEWLAKARVSYDFVVGTPFTAPNQTGFNTGAYGAGSVQDRDNRLWAAVEMWETTGESQYLQYFESLAAPNMHSHLGWQDVSVLAGITYLMSDKPGRRQALVDSLRSSLFAAANALANNSNSHAYGRLFGTASYYWGNHGALTANSYILNAAAKLATSESDRVRYRNAAHEIMNNIFGRNPFARSFVTGVGHNPPQNPHCRRSIADSIAWPGYLIGGPHNSNLTESGGNPIAPPGASCPAPGACYFDDYRDYARNEIAINWNASMIYALSGFLYTGTEASVQQASRVSPPGSAQPRIKTTRMVHVRSGKAMNIPVGARVYSLDGKLVAHRRAGDAMPVIRRNGVFIIRMDDKKRK
jgi:endoglucanase